MKHDRIAPCPKTECTQTFTLVSFVLLFLLSSISPKIRKINTICAAHCKREDRSLTSYLVGFWMTNGSYAMVVQISGNFRIFKIVDNSNACIFGIKRGKNDFRCSLQAGRIAPYTHLSSVSA